jgi:hypothetical protein
MKTKHAIKLLDKAYSVVSGLVKNNNDYETIELIQPLLDKIDELQFEIKNL